MWVTTILIAKLSYQKSSNPLLALLLPPSLSSIKLSDLASSQPDHCLLTRMCSWTEQRECSLKVLWLSFIPNSKVKFLVFAILLRFGQITFCALTWHWIFSSAMTRIYFAEPILENSALVYWLWDETHVLKVVDSNPSTIYWMDIFINLIVVNIVKFIWKDKNKRKRGRGWHILKKNSGSQN